MFIFIPTQRRDLQRLHKSSTALSGAGKHNDNLWGISAYIASKSKLQFIQPKTPGAPIPFLSILSIIPIFPFLAPSNAISGLHDIDIWRHD